MLNHWTFLDLFFAGIMLLSIALAVSKGLAREITSLVALIAGFVLAAIYYPVPTHWLAEFTRNESVARLLGFMILFLGILFAGALISFIINRFLKAASIKWVDRLLGGTFGLLRGWAICSVIVLALVAFPVRDRIMAHSFLAPFLLAGARTAVLMVPHSLRDQFNEQYKKVLHAWNESRSVQ